MSTYPARGMQRILAGSVTPELRVVLCDQDGEAVAAEGTLTCSIARADGTEIVADRATTAAATGVGAYTCELATAEALTLDVLTATWRISGVTRATTHHRVVGGFMFSIAELAQRAGMEQFDAATLRAERERVTDLIELHTGVSWCPTYDYDETEAPDRCRVVTHRPLRSVRSMSIDGAAQDTTEFDIDAPAGIIEARYTLWGRRMALGVEHGYDEPPADLKDAALTAAADRILREYSPLGARVRTMSNDLGVTQQFSYAGAGHPTGIDEVDAVINANDHRTPAIA